MQYAVISSAGAVLNIVEWDGSQDFPVNTGEKLVQSDNLNCHIGGEYVNGVFSAQAELDSNGSLINPVPASDS